MVKSSHINQNTFNKDGTKNTNKSGQVGGIKNQGTLLSSAGL